MTSNYILRVDCPDRPGLVAAVSGCLYENDCNIEEASQFNDDFSGRFFMRVVFAGNRAGFEDKFSFVAEKFDMDWDVMSADYKTKALILVSKTDHCLHDILYRTRTDHLPLEICGVVSNHEDCRTLVEQNNLAYHHFPVDADSRSEQEEKIVNLIEKTGAELIVLARYMQVLSDSFCSRYPGQIINIHHSFLPGFKGARPYHQAWERGVKVIGATAHFVTPDLDEGPIIEQETSRVDHALGPAEMQVLGRDIEAKVLSRALLLYAQRRIFLHGDRTVIL